MRGATKTDITRARDIIAGFDFRVETEPAGGYGLPGA